jgi:hypothetical protein
VCVWCVSCFSLRPSLCLSFPVNIYQCLTTVEARYALYLPTWGCSLLRVPMVPWVHLRQPSVPHFTPLWGEPFQLSPLDRDQQIFNPRPTFHLSTPEAPVLCSMTLSCPCTFQHHPPPPPGSPHRHRQTFNWQPPTLGRASRLWVIHRLRRRCSSSHRVLLSACAARAPRPISCSTTTTSLALLAVLSLHSPTC